MANQPPSDGTIIALITCADAAEAERIATALIEARLAACAQWHGHASLYRWQGRLERGEETRLLVKTTRAAWPGLLAMARALHSYDLPAILAVEPCAILPEFADWVRAETG